MDNIEMAVQETAELLSTETCADIQTTACIGINVVNAVCVDYIDLGTQETPWGLKPQCKYVFETELLKESGYPINVTRTFTKSLHEKSSLRAFIKDWRGEDLPVEEISRFKHDRNIGKPCKVTVEDTISKNGFPYLKLVTIAPAGEKKIKPCGLYKRFDSANN
jgi:hypothetical protein